MAAPLKIEWSPRADRELEAIHEHIAAERPKVAAAMKEKLVAAADSLSVFPDRGREVGRSRELVAVYPFVMRYRVARDHVVVLRLRHGAQRA